MKVKTLIEKLQSMQQEAEVKLHQQQDIMELHQLVILKVLL